MPPLTNKPNPAKEAENRHYVDLRLFEIGQRLTGTVLDEEQIQQLGDELIALSGICRKCRGKSCDQDEEGGVYPCTCNGGKVPLPDLTDPN